MGRIPRRSDQRHHGVSELLVGVHRAETEARRSVRSAFVEAILGQIPVLDYTPDVARVHARLFATLSRQGQMIGAHDLIIAATAIHHDSAILTTNDLEFRRVSELEAIELSR